MPPVIRPRKIEFNRATRWGGILAASRSEMSQTETGAATMRERPFGTHVCTAPFWSHPSTVLSLRMCVFVVSPSAASAARSSELFTVALQGWSNTLGASGQRGREHSRAAV